ncbi:hypothetical protein S83_036017 [Arachis hypogaea]
MSVVAKLGTEDANEFVVARDGIARLAEELQRLAYDKLGGPPGLSSLSGLKDPVVSKTKGAPRKGKEMHPGSEGDVLMKRQRCMTCGVPGHTKRTCTSQRDHGVAGTDGCTVHSSTERSSAKPSAPYAAGRTQDADNDENALAAEHISLVVRRIPDMSSEVVISISPFVLVTQETWEM